MPRLVSVNVNAERQFRNMLEADAHPAADFGLQGDRHAGGRGRQVSIPSAETIDELAGHCMPVGRA